MVWRPLKKPPFDSTAAANPNDRVDYLRYIFCVSETYCMDIIQMRWELVKAVLILPGTVIVIIPAVILKVSQTTRFSAALLLPNQILFWLAALAALNGLVLAIWTVSLFMKFGGGTPAPWKPPKDLVIRGPYRYVRNPMITGALLLLLALTMFFQSRPLAIWMIIFFIGNAIYFPLIEEKHLEKRFGTAYTEYKAHVPRWIPRLRAWRQPGSE